ncbi:MAG: 16S rRNA (adenine(1518)-N(6)/adenine(1519)-N(6))-dimethyltransferase RsmA, partial [Bryobacteraceae bacterium]
MPRKLGQHFLVRQAILERIADVACEGGTPRVIEIGPGRGALTRHLLSRTEELHAIELDDSLASYLDVEFRANARFHLHRGDVLQTDLTQWGPAAIAGNLPYYITSPIVERFLALDERFPRAVFLVQKDVAERLRASPGSRDYGFLSVRTQLFCDVELILKAPPSVFTPPPKVDSAVVRLTRRTNIAKNAKSIVQFASRCFAQKRKTLRNNLRGFYDPRVIDSLPEAGLRAEQI